MKTKRWLSAQWIVIGIALFLMILLILAPLLQMFFRMEAESISKVFEKESLWTVIGNSFLSATLTTLISLMLAFFLALCTERTAMPCKGLVRYLSVLPMLIPSVSIGMGTVILGGNNGLISNFFGIEGGKIYGLLGIVWGSVMYSFPVAFLMIVNVLRYEDSSPYDAAKVLGIPLVRRFFSITLPYMRKPLVAVAFSVFTLSFTDYGIPLMVGGKFKTLPMVMYQEVIGQLDFGKGCVYGSILLIPAVVAFLIDLASRKNSNSSYIVIPFEPKKSVFGAVSAFTGSLLVALLASLPILVFAFLAFVKKYPANMTLTVEHFVRTMESGGGKYLLNSLTIAICVAVVGTIWGITVAYFSARTKGRCIRFLHLLAMATGAIPGIVLGLAYVLLFKGSPVYGTVVILVMVNTVHFFASPYLMMYTSFSKVNENLEAVASTLGVGKFSFLIQILLPACKGTVLEMLSFFFVNSMMTISAISFLANTANKPIALMINQFEAQAQLEAVAVVSLLILLINFLVKSVLEGRIKNNNKLRLTKL